MTYKESIQIICGILALSKNLELKKDIEQQLQPDVIIDWDKMVAYSSGHMVFQALYIQLKKHHLLKFLPQDLVVYAQHITKLNSERNFALKSQAKVIKSLLTKQDIKPIFLKGMAYLLEGLYQNLGERMIGDIDFLVSQPEVETVAAILKKNGYQYQSKPLIQQNGTSKHYPRLVHPDYIGAVEIHWSLVNKPHQNVLTYQDVFENKMQINEFWVPSYPHQAIHNMLNTQINDQGMLKGKVMLRQFYDGYLLSFKPDVTKALSAFKPIINKKNAYLNLIDKLFKSKCYANKNILLKILMFRYDLTIYFPEVNQLVNVILYLSMRFYNYPKVIFKALYSKEARTYITERIKNPDWYQAHLNSYKNGS